MSTAYFRLKQDVSNAASASRSGRLLGRERTGRVVAIVLLARDESKTPTEFRKLAKRRVRANVGFVWWLPLALWAAEIVIKILIERWQERNV